MSELAEQTQAQGGNLPASARHPIIDSDGHVMEPVDLWQRYTPAALRDRAPRPLSADVMTNAAMIIDGVQVGRQHKAYLDEDKARFAMDVQADYSVKNQLAGMDKEGIAAAVLYPTRGLLIMGTSGIDPVVTTAAAAAYNQWLNEFCSEGNGRLFAAGMIDPRDIASARTEARRCVKEFGFTAIFLRPNPVNGLSWHDPAYDPLWAEIADLDVPVCFHEGSMVMLPQVGTDRFSEIALWHVCTHPMEQQMAMLSMIMGGVAERHPRLRMAFLECGAGWLPYWLWRMDEHHEKYHARLQLTMPPSAYAQRQCFVSIDSDEQTGMTVLDAEMGANPRTVWGSDYPHPDGKFPHALKTLAGLQGMEAERFRHVVLDAPQALYGARVKA